MPLDIGLGYPWFKENYGIYAIAAVIHDKAAIPVLLSFRGRSAVLLIPNEFGPHPDRNMVIDAYKQEKGIS